MVLDIHRDAIHPSDTTRVKPTATVNGKKAAQMMIIAGVVSTDSLPHKNWQQNFHFALSFRYLDILSTIPIEAVWKTNAVPPYEKNGRGTPVGGIEEVATPILRIN